MLALPNTANRMMLRYPLAGLATLFAVLFAILLVSGAANAVPCRTGGSYDKWLADFEREAMAQGVSQRTIATAAPFLTYDQRIVNIDHGQRVFTQTFLEFSDRMAAAYRIQRGNQLIKTYAQVFDRIDKQYGALPFADIKAMQGMLAHAGYDVGSVEGFLGLKTRQAVKAMQLKYGLPADSYPTAELLARMRPGR
jgi:membrane-bound lytic murein transglycosylase B